MELIKISSSPKMCKHSLWKREKIDLVDMTIQTLKDSVDAKVKLLQAQGMTHFILKFDATAEDGESMPYCIVQGSRLESEDEMAERIKQEEARNDREIKAHAEKLANIARRKEIERLTKHLTTEQLRNITNLSI